MEDIRKKNIIIESKKAYKLLGKDPNRYRLSSEALLKRIINNKGLYKINNTVDIINLVSIESGFSICGFNSKKIDGNIKLGIGNKNEDYLAIGRGKLNIENLPIFRDNIGAFGSPTSDSVRTQITDDCKNISMIIISFNGENKLLENLEKTNSLLEEYCSASDFEYYIM
jgi:DNA/RNA-binding domain of Phe-tRNA-synthetase-like protein